MKHFRTAIGVIAIGIVLSNAAEVDAACGGSCGHRYNGTQQHHSQNIPRQSNRSRMTSQNRLHGSTSFRQRSRTQNQAPHYYESAPIVIEEHLSGVSSTPIHESEMHHSGYLHPVAEASHPNGSQVGNELNGNFDFSNSPINNPFARKNKQRDRASSILPWSNGEGTIIDITSNNPSFTTFITALQVAGLLDELKQEGPYTLLAPTNDAFAKLPPGTVQTLFKPENKDKLKQILAYHVIKGKVMSPDLKRSHIKTENGKIVDITLRGRAIFIDNAEVVNTDIVGSNGVIHVIDAVLIP